MQGLLRPRLETDMMSFPLPFLVNASHRPAQIQGVKKLTPLLDGKSFRVILKRMWIQGGVEK